MLIGNYLATLHTTLHVPAVHAALPEPQRCFSDGVALDLEINFTFTLPRREVRRDSPPPQTNKACSVHIW